MFVHCMAFRDWMGKAVDMETLPDNRAETWLTVVRTQGDLLAHLAPRGGTEYESLCGRPLRARPPHRSFRRSGCQACLLAALAAGHVVAQEDRAWLNLNRIPVSPGA